MAWTDPRTWTTGELVTAALLNVHLRDNLKALGDPWTAYTPAWTAATTNPTLGNGTLTGHYIKVGRLVIYRVRLVFGSTTGVGSGAYNFSLPFAGTAHDVAGSGMARDDSAVNHTPLVPRLSSSTTIDLFATTTGTVVNHSNLYTWAANDRINITGTYEATS